MSPLPSFRTGITKFYNSKKSTIDLWEISAGLLVFLVLISAGIYFDPLPELQDSGGSGIDGSQNSRLTVRNTRTGRTTTYRLRSFLEPGGINNLAEIKGSDMRAMATEVQRLKDNPCYDVTVRSLATCSAVNQAVETCDIVFLTAHGSANPPYLTWGGRRSAQCTSGPTRINANRIWIGACHAPAIVNALNGSGGSRYETLPANNFGNTGKIGRRTVAKALVSQLAALQDTVCETPTKICLMAGTQDLEKQ